MGHPKKDDLTGYFLIGLEAGKLFSILGATARPASACLEGGTAHGCTHVSYVTNFANSGSSGWARGHGAS